MLHWHMVSVFYFMWVWGNEKFCFHFVFAVFVVGSFFMFLSEANICHGIKLNLADYGISNSSFRKGQ